MSLEPLRRPHTPPTQSQFIQAKPNQELHLFELFNKRVQKRQRTLPGTLKNHASISNTLDFAEAGKTQFQPSFKKTALDTQPDVPFVVQIWRKPKNPKNEVLNLCVQDTVEYINVPMTESRNNFL